LETGQPVEWPEDHGGRRWVAIRQAPWAGGCPVSASLAPSPLCPSTLMLPSRFDSCLGGQVKAQCLRDGGCNSCGRSGASTSLKRPTSQHPCKGRWVDCRYNGDTGDFSSPCSSQPASDARGPAIIYQDSTGSTGLIHLIHLTGSTSKRNMVEALIAACSSLEAATHPSVEKPPWC
jgi:hypothetical protein